MPCGPISIFIERELEIGFEYLHKIVAKWKILASKRPVGSTIVFLRKCTGRLRLCVAYLVLNKVTMRNSYCVALMLELRDGVSRAKVFTNLDLKDRYYLVWMNECDEWKRVFCTRNRWCDSTVMPFGLGNPSSTFQNKIKRSSRIP